MSVPHTLAYTTSPYDVKNYVRMSPISRTPLPKDSRKLAGDPGDTHHAKQIPIAHGRLAELVGGGLGLDPRHAPHVDANHWQSPLGTRADDYHWWQVPLYITNRGLTTSAIPFGGRTFQIDLDFIEHSLQISVDNVRRDGFALGPRSVADLHTELLS